MVHLRRYMSAVAIALLCACPCRAQTESGPRVEAGSRPKAPEPADRTSRYAEADSLFASGRYAEARKAFAAALPREGGPPLAIYKDMLCRLVLGDREGAETAARQLAPSTDHPAWYFARAALALADHREDRALYFLTSASQLYAETDNLRFLMALQKIGWLTKDEVTGALLPLTSPSREPDTRSTP
ncbi:MAG: hypothetical protein JXB04_00380 [Kiritimatiellae bacterium]|nr:hypothetical protein [Kiritimatiellia bacterium]